MDLRTQFDLLTQQTPVDEPPEPNLIHNYAEQEINISAELRALNAEIAKRSLSEFVKKAWHVQHSSEPLIWNWHLQVVCDHVQFLYEELARAKADPNYQMVVHNCVINVPPRSLKSYIVSVYAPAWAWARWPNLKIRCTSGNPDNVSRDARRHRFLLDSDWYVSSFGQMKFEVDGVHWFQNTQQGERRSKGLSAKVTGQGSDCIVVDDPHDATDALSEVQRDAAIERWRTSLESRVESEKRCIRIIIMQRLHELDLSGFVLAQNVELAAGVRSDWSGDDMREFSEAELQAETLKRGGWDHVMIPMEFEPERVKSGTVIGWVDPRVDARDLLAPEQFDKRFVANKRVSLGAYGYAGQMQQNPAPLEGGLFKRVWWNWHRPDGKAAHGPHPRPPHCLSREDTPATKLPSFYSLVLTVDAAFKDKVTSSRVSIQVIGASGSGRYILDNVTMHMDFTKTVSEIKKMVKKWPRINRKYIEDKANGSAIITTLRKTIGGVIGINPEGGKESRAQAVSAYIEAGDVYLPDGAAWVADYVNEHAVFPNGQFDDQVDATSQALNKMKGSSAIDRGAMLGQV